ncbi:hypothetical protein BD413DRAFT_570391 [Trametes elegans]|nr:hypothetical protein BD413DRAFT_570391 [Trametes elegans]
MFAAKFTAIFATLAAAATAVSAAPAVFSGAKQEIVYRPDITSPKAGDSWPAGSVQTVTWDVSDIPEEAKNHTGILLLGFIEGNSTNENLDVEHPLATEFPIIAGSAQVTVPDVESRDDYVIVLFGDSGNTSPKFTITNDDASAAPISGTSVPTSAVLPAGLPTILPLPSFTPTSSSVA